MAAAVSSLLLPVVSVLAAAATAPTYHVPWLWNRVVLERISKN